ncbi:unnamed protein product [Eruca vesicaria subsp. sativa]|uniref:SANT domain-containing protein n=1 Tax=Eruca vesicaria subsp. sativa TaxID=29727 RepID=A0ABC8K3Z1_ERUVS|nr:unnamed protein product [Eruca vesicaria subsp. sativa]
MEPFHSDDDAMEEGMESPYQHGINGEPQLLPRVGDQYQAVIPRLVPEDDRLKLIRCFGLEPHLVTFGLPIPLMWTRSEKFRGFREIEFEGEGRPPCRHVSSARMRPRSLVLALPCQKNAKLKFGWLDKSLYPFPGTLGESWEDSEKERFLLGLYFLGKNLVLLQRFVGSKKMGDMLSYYYGSFYRSNEYKRWVDGRKSRRSRRSVQGHKLLTDWRQQELLSRISCHVSEECKSMLLKVYKAFREDRIALEEYVFTLKNLVGIDMLTEAIGIGKGKKDLTNSALEPTKLNPGASKVRIRNDLPVADIVKFLTGEYRMSKTRSSDLFWEAVWPRLLARGWHSEQPEDGPKNSLVFLIPEADKFSRRDMSKGNHYFDTLTDVLNKVALDPTLLELTTDDIGRSKDEEIKNDPPIDIEESDDDSSQNNKKKKRYLQPRIKSSKSQEVTMFTIVDTSGVKEGCTLKELRSLPIETCNSVANPPTSYLSESEDYQLSEDYKNKAETATVSISPGKSSSVNMDSSSTISLNESLQKNRKRGRPRNPKLLHNRGSLVNCAQKSMKKGTKMRPSPLEADQNVVLTREEHIDTLKLSSAEDSCCGRNKGCRQISPGRLEIREDFDLNVSQISLEGEAFGVDNSESSCAQQSSIQMDEEKQCKTRELQVSGGPGRRQSTRTRPLTAKALEAFAFGYLGNSEKKKKSTEVSRKKYTKRIRKEQALNHEESSS